jgi:hypothetical protein
MGREDGAMEQVAPAGSPAPQLSVTVVLSPGAGVTVRFTVPDCPDSRLSAEVLAERWKLGGATVIVIGVEVAAE